VFVGVRKTGFGLLALGGAVTAIFLVLVPSALAAAPTYNMVGTWTTGYRSGSTLDEQNGTWDITTMNMSTGAFSGTAEIEGTQFTLTGTESGAEVQQELTEGGYAAQDAYSLSVLSSGHVGTDNGTFNGGEFWAELTGPAVEPGKKAKEEEKAKEEAAKKAKEEAEKSAKRPSATSVTCNYEFATSTDTCTAQVADAGPAPAIVPTGTVTFTNTGAGGFPYGTTCTIAASASAPGVPFCSVIFLGGGSGLPMITASYGGDSHHSPSDGSTSFAQFGPPEETGEEFAFGGPDQFPETVTVETEVPAEGTTVDGTINEQTGEETNPPDPNSPIGIALDSIPKVALPRSMGPGRRT
jgi:hypothetical protein